MTEPAAADSPSTDPKHWESWAEEWGVGWIRAELDVLEKRKRPTTIDAAKISGYRAALKKITEAEGGACE